MKMPAKEMLSSSKLRNGKQYQSETCSSERERRESELLHREARRVVEVEIFKQFTRFLSANQSDDDCKQIWKFIK